MIASLTVAIGMMVGGLIGVAVGIPLISIGGQKVPVATGKLTITPRTGGATAGVSFRF